MAVGRFWGWVVWYLLTTVSLCTMVIGAQIVGMTQYPKSIDMFVGIAMLGIGGFLTTRCIVGIVQWILQGMRRGKRVG